MVLRVLTATAGGTGRASARSGTVGTESTREGGPTYLEVGDEDVERIAVHLQPLDQRRPLPTVVGRPGQPQL